MVSHAVAALLTAVAGNCLGRLVCSLCCCRFFFFFVKPLFEEYCSQPRKKNCYSFSRPSFGSFALPLPVICYLRVVTCDILESSKTKKHIYVVISRTNITNEAHVEFYTAVRSGKYVATSGTNAVKMRSRVG